MTKKGYISNIEEETVANTDFRRVLYTSQFSQLVLMSLKPGEDIGEEIHELDQFLRVEAGAGVAKLGEAEHPVSDGTAIVVPAGVTHNITNTGEVPLKLYTIYSPPEHLDGTVRATKEEAEAPENEEHFDGVTSE
jgi:mannose-6-phosphate isomerase-like protein (cupin superfamily)